MGMRSTAAIALGLALVAGCTDDGKGPEDELPLDGTKDDSFRKPTNHGIIDYMVVTNVKWWDGLAPDVKKGLSEAMAEATAYGNKLANDINEGDKKKIADAGKAKIQKLSKEDVAAWRKAMEPVWKKFEGDIGRDLIDAALKSNK